MSVQRKLNIEVNDISVLTHFKKKWLFYQQRVTALLILGKCSPAFDTD
jgi:hypothetical protein